MSRFNNQFPWTSIQQEVYNILYKEITNKKSSNSSFLILMPRGSGKTFLAKALQKEFDLSYYHGIDGYRTRILGKRDICLLDESPRYYDNIIDLLGSVRVACRCKRIFWLTSDMPPNNEELFRFKILDYRNKYDGYNMDTIEYINVAGWSSGSLTGS